MPPILIIGNQFELSVENTLIQRNTISLTFPIIFA